MSTFTELKIEKIDTGTQANQWGGTTNTNWEAICAAVTGTADVTFSNADLDITLAQNNTAQAARNLRLNLTGSTTAARNLFFTGAAAGSGACIEKFYVINNTLSFDITVRNKIAGTPAGTSITIPALKSTVVFNTGSNFVDAITHLDSLTLGSLNIGSALDVTSGGTSLATLPANNVILGNGTNTPLFVAPGTFGNLLTSDGTTWQSSGLAPEIVINGSLTSTNTGIARFDGTSGTFIEDSPGATISDTGNLGLGIVATSKIHAFEASSAPTIQLENGNTAPVFGTDLGAIFFVSNDNSTNANGPRVKLIGKTAGTTGAGRLSITVRAGSSNTDVNPFFVQSSGFFYSSGNTIADGNTNQFFGIVQMNEFDTTVDVDLSSAFQPSTTYFYYMDATVVGIYDPFPSAGARLWKRWQQGVFYDGSNFTLPGAALIGAVFNSDATNFPAGAVNAVKVQTIVNSTQVLLRFTNRTTPAVGSITYYSYSVDIRKTS